MSNEAKKIEISVGISVGNGRWDESKVEETVHVEHVIDVGLLDDEGTFKCVMDKVCTEFEDGIRGAIGKALDQMAAREKAGAAKTE